MNSIKPNAPKAKPKSGLKPHQYITLRVDLLGVDGISLAAKNTAALLWLHRNKKTGQCNPGLGTLAGELLLPKRQVRRAVHELRAVGIITKTKHGRRSDHYTLAPVLEWPKLIALHAPFRVAKTDISRGAKFDTSKASASLLTEKHNTNKEENTVCSPGGGGSAGTGRAPNTHTTHSPTHKKPRSENRERAVAMIDALAETHPKPGGEDQAVELLAAILDRSADVATTLVKIRESHRRWCDFWDLLPPGQFRAMLHIWFSNGDWSHPPNDKAMELHRKPAATAGRSRKEMIDNA